MRMKTALTHLHKALTDLATVAAGLENKNLHDQIAAAAGRLQMAMEHPDAENPAIEKLFAEMLRDREGVNPSEPTSDLGPAPTGAPAAPVPPTSPQQGAIDLGTPPGDTGAAPQGQ